MRAAQLTRDESSDVGTFGTLLTDSGFTCRTGELPWRDNLPDKSCIPAGKYLCVWGPSPKHGDCYHVEVVPGRSDIEIHIANFVGDEAQGYRCDVLGCIAVGLGVGLLGNQRAVLYSTSGLAQLEEDLKQESFELTILNAPSVGAPPATPSAA